MGITGWCLVVTFPSILHFLIFEDIDAKIIAISFTVFGAFLIEKCEFYSQLIEEYKKKIITSIVNAQKTVKDRAMIFASIFFSDFSAMNSQL